MTELYISIVLNYIIIYRITKNFHNKKLSRNVTQQHFVKKSFVKEGLAYATDTAALNFVKKNFCGTLKSTKFTKVLVIWYHYFTGYW